MRIYRAHFIWNDHESITYGYYSSQAAANEAVTNHIAHEDGSLSLVEVIEVEISKAGLLDALNEYASGHVE